MLSNQTPRSDPSAPYDLRSEYHENPLGLGTETPRLSWKHRPGQAVEQTGWQVRAASHPELLETNPDVLDTGRRRGGDSLFLPWPGEPLASRQRVYWQVRAWLRGHTGPTDWSDAAFLETGLLQPGDWTAQWIAFGEDGKTGSPPAPYLRTQFTLQAAPVRARLYASALGLFDFHLNGAAVHPQDVLAPGWTDFRHRTQVLTFDVTSQVRQGKNSLGAILGDGWYAGYLGFGDTRQIYGQSPALLAQLEIELTDGTSVRIVSDGTWRGRTGPILASDLYHGETYDARQELPEWTVPEAVGAGWEPVTERPELPGLRLEAKVGKPIQHAETIAPIGVTEPTPGVYIFDLGQNIVGWARMRLTGKRGQQITLRFGEMLQADGTLYTTNLRSARATDRYTFGQDGIAEWEPRFTFHGFRYVELTGVDAAPTLAAITGVVVHSAMRPTGQFACSHPLVNQLTSNIRWGLKGNFLDVPTDCPQRDERLGWTGDAQVFAKTASFLYDTDAFFVKWMRDLRDGQTADGAFPDIAPTFICGFGNAAWADAGVLVPWIVYRRFGDRRILEENYDAMCAWIGYQERTSRDLVRPPTAYGDWLAIDAVSPERAPVPSDLIGTAYFARTCAIMIQVATLLNHPADRAQFSRLHRQVRRAFQRTFVTPQGRVVGDCQTAYLLALAFDLLPKHLESAAVETLVQLIETRQWHLSTGFVGTPLLCPVLSRFGRHDVAMRLLLQDTYPGWLFPVKNGATTMWERWNSYTPEAGFGDAGMNSFNHYAYGAIGEWMVHRVAGIAPGPSLPAYRHILFRPQPCPGLDRASAQIETPYGPAAITWQTEGDAMTGRVTVPPNAFADFQSCFSDGEIVPASGGQALPFQPDANTRLLSGEYSFHGTI